MRRKERIIALEVDLVTFDLTEKSVNSKLKLIFIPSVRFTSSLFVFIKPEN